MTKKEKIRIARLLETIKTDEAQELSRKIYNETTMYNFECPSTNIYEDDIDRNYRDVCRLLDKPTNYCMSDSDRDTIADMVSNYINDNMSEDVEKMFDSAIARMVVDKALAE